MGWPLALYFAWAKALTRMSPTTWSPKYVIETFEHYLACGDLSQVFLLAECPSGVPDGHAPKPTKGEKGGLAKEGRGEGHREAGQDPKAREDHAEGGEEDG